MNGPRISIVVLTHNRKTELLRTLTQLSDVRDIPIIVVDNASADGTADAVTKRFPRVELVRLSHNAGAAGRNAGVHAATTPYVAFCDDDSWWHPESLMTAAAAFDAHPLLAVVTGRVLVGESGREDPTNARMAASPFPNTLGLRGSAVFGFLAGACMMRRAAFLDAGGFHPRLFLGSEERLLAVDLMTAGWHMAYLPDAVICHHPSRLRDMAARRRLIVRNGLWSAWLRRPLSSALRETGKWLDQGRRDGCLASSALAALGGVIWVLRERRVVPHRVEAALRQLDAFDAGPVPQYVEPRASADVAVGRSGAT